MIPRILETPTNMTVTVLMTIEQFNAFNTMIIQQLMDDEFNEGFRHAIMDDDHSNKE